MKETSKTARGINPHLSDGEIALCAQEMVAGNYPEKVAAQLLHHIHECTACREAVWELYHLIAGEPTVIEAIRKDAMLKTKPIEKGKVFGRKRKMFSINQFGYVAAAAALIILLVAVFYFLNQKPVHEQLFTQYYSPYHDVVTSKSQAERNFLLDGLFYYNTAQYDSAIDKFISGLEVRHDDQDLIFYLGSSYLAAGNHEKAIISFERLFEPGSKYYSPARWYLALAYLGANDLDEARKIFEDIIAEGGFYAGKAGEIVERMR